MLLLFFRFGVLGNSLADAFLCFRLQSFFTDSFTPTLSIQNILQTISTKDAEGFDLKGCLKDLQAAHHSDSESEGGDEEGRRWSDDEDDEDDDDDSVPELTNRNDSSDSDSDEEGQYVRRIARKKVKTAGNPTTRVHVKTEWMSRSSTPLAGVNYTLCVPTSDPDVEELIPEAGADAV